MVSIALFRLVCLVTRSNGTYVLFDLNCARLRPIKFSKRFSLKITVYTALTYQTFSRVFPYLFYVRYKNCSSEILFSYSMSFIPFHYLL